MSSTVWATESAEYKAFFDAVTNGHLQELKASINSNVKLDALLGDGLEGEAALHIAVAKNHVDIVQLLLASGAFVDVPAISRFGLTTPLHVAAGCALPTLVNLLLDHGANPNAIGEMDGTPLHMVLKYTLRVDSMHIETIKLLLDRGLEIDALAPEIGGTVLHQAAEFSNIELIKELIKRGANINDQRAFQSVLAVASSHGEYEVAKVLLEHGARVDGDALGSARSMELVDLLRIHADDLILSSCGILHNACSGWAQSPDYLAQLLERGFDINSRDKYGDTPLLGSCGDSYAKPEIVEVLVRNGADINARNTKAYHGDVTIGDTPLHRASRMSVPKVVELLINAGADLAARNSQGQTPLMKFALCMDKMCEIAIPDPRLEVFKMVLGRDGDTSAVDKKSRTALHLLGVGGDGNQHYQRNLRTLEAARMLVKAGIPVDAVDADGRTAMDIFLSSSDFEMVQLLSEERATNGEDLGMMTGKLSLKP